MSQGSRPGPPLGGAFADSNWPSQLNRPVLVGNVLTWVGPSGGGPNNGNPVQQTRTLTASGNITTSADNQIIEGLNISGNVVIQNNNVTLRQCSIVSGNVPNGVVHVGTVSGTIIEDCYVAGTGAADVNTSSISEASATPTGSIYRRNNLAFTRNSITFGKTNSTMSDCWAHDLADIFTDGSPPHFQNVDMNGSSAGATIRHNTLINDNVNNNTAVIQINDSIGGAFTNVTVDHNLIITNSYAFEVTNTFNNSAGCSWSCTNNEIILAQEAVCDQGSISGTVLTVAGNLFPGPYVTPGISPRPWGSPDLLVGLGGLVVASFTTITSQLTGTPGGAGTYQLSPGAQTVGPGVIVAYSQNGYFYETSPIVPSPFTGNIDYYSRLAIPGP